MEDEWEAVGVESETVQGELKEAIKSEADRARQPTLSQRQLRMRVRQATFVRRV